MQKQLRGERDVVRVERARHETERTWMAREIAEGKITMAKMAGEKERLEQKVGIIEEQLRIVNDRY